MRVFIVGEYIGYLVLVHSSNIDAAVLHTFYTTITPCPSSLILQNVAKLASVNINLLKAASQSSILWYRSQGCFIGVMNRYWQLLISWYMILMKSFIKLWTL